MNLAGVLDPTTRTVLLVEGESDRAAVEALARRRALPLGPGRVQVIPMGGVTNLGHHLAALSAHPDVRVGGLYDAGEEHVVVRSLERAGLRPPGDTSPLPTLGFFGCERDLEDELVRALGVEGCLAVIAAQGALRSLERLRGQPAQRGWSTAQVVHRFLGSGSGRKELYARLFTEAVPDERVPEPLDAALRWALAAPPPASPT
ncbi:MAG TPA: TOPRIM nucleotidyl transferase/hydrolase domain-containing protein [Promicromonospora sp.]|nr:TOPRIM nucleotidyl transferase/hydrolase domain-containing protein [Promicromonospora sp.]